MIHQHRVTMKIKTIYRKTVALLQTLANRIRGKADAGAAGNQSGNLPEGFVPLVTDQGDVILVHQSEALRIAQEMDRRKAVKLAAAVKQQNKYKRKAKFGSYSR